MTNKIKALLITPCVLIFTSALVYGLEVLFHSNYGVISIVTLASALGGWLVYSIVLSLLEDV